MIWQFYQDFSAHAVNDLEIYYPKALQVYKSLESHICSVLAKHISSNQSTNVYNQSVNPVFLSELNCFQLKALAQKQFVVKEISQKTALNEYCQFVINGLIKKTS